jgi:hypothetical protein
MVPSVRGTEDQVLSTTGVGVSLPNCSGTSGVQRCCSHDKECHIGVACCMYRQPRQWRAGSVEICSADISKCIGTLQEGTRQQYTTLQHYNTREKEKERKRV